MEAVRWLDQVLKDLQLVFVSSFNSTLVSLTTTSSSSSLKKLAIVWIGRVESGKSEKGAGQSVLLLSADLANHLSFDFFSDSKLHHTTFMFEAWRSNCLLANSLFRYATYRLLIAFHKFISWNSMIHLLHFICKIQEYTKLLTQPIQMFNKLLVNLDDYNIYL